MTGEGAINLARKRSYNRRAQGSVCPCEECSSRPRETRSRELVIFLLGESSIAGDMSGIAPRLSWSLPIERRKQLRQMKQRQMSI
jgi:hypothetical protein